MTKSAYDLPEQVRREVEHLCEVMHDAYEKAAAAEGWETQERSRKPWSEVPEANRRTMRLAVLAMLTDLNDRGRMGAPWRGIPVSAKSDESAPA